MVSHSFLLFFFLLFVQASPVPAQLLLFGVTKHGLQRKYKRFSMLQSHTLGKGLIAKQLLSSCMLSFPTVDFIYKRAATQHCDVRAFKRLHGRQICVKKHRPKAMLDLLSFGTTKALSV